MECCQQVPWLQEWAESISAIASCLSIILTVLGFRYIYKQVRSSTADHLYTRMFEIHKIFMEKPELYEYLNSDAVPEDKKEKVQLDILVEMIVDLAELVFVEIDNLPKETAKAWRAYMNNIFKESKKVQAFLDAHSGWYSVTRNSFNK